MSYKAFLSYSHTVDSELSAALQSALHRFAKPWNRLRAVRVFRDVSSLSATPALWPSVEAALSDSEFFLLLASPEAACSAWVRREVDWWLAHRAVSKLLIIMTGGELRWDGPSGDFDWNTTTALPPDLRGRFEDEPLYVDLRWAKSATDFSLRHSRFRSAVLAIAAPLHGISKDELDGEDVRQHRRTLRWAWSAAALLLCTALAAILAAFSALRERNIAVSEQLTAQAELIRTESPALLDRSVLLALEAMRLEPSVESSRAVREGLSILPVQVWTIRHPRENHFLAFCPDGQSLVTGSSDGTVGLYSVRDGKEVWKVSESLSVSAALCSPNGQYVISTGYDVVTFDTHGGKKIWEVAGTSPISALALVLSPQ